MKRTFSKNGTINLAAGVGTRRAFWRPWMTWVASGLGVIIILLGGLTLYYWPKAQRVMAAGKAAVADAKKIPNDLSAQKFTDARAHVDATLTNLREAQSGFQQMQGLRAWPFIGRQYKAVDSLLSVGDQSVQAMGTLVVFLEDVFAPFKDRGKISLATISTAEKGTLLGNISARGEELRGAQEKIHVAAATLDQVPTKGLIPQLADGVRTLKDQFPLITQALDEAIPATKVLPTILGYPTEKTYLFLLENNTELRPGGGFIGTYGVLRVASGEIVSLKTDNVYNLDNAAKKLSPIQPPAAIQKYLHVNRWDFRDSNWSPDFPTSAAQALFLYQREGGVKNVDGVIAVTPTAIASLLKLVGPLKVDGVEFTSDNLVQRLEYQVEQGFLRAGLSEKDRKDIIGDLSSALMSKIMNLPLSEWSNLFLTMSGDLEGKQILIWVNDTTVENMLVAQNWAGAVDQRTDTDYVMVADANLASLKTDQVMLRRYTYTVKPDGDGALATLTVSYQNTGKFAWNITRYNTYVRVYVPAGATLVDSRGAQLREKSNAAGKVETSTELGKTVFTAFKSIEPGTTSDLVLTYRLPTSVTDQWKGNIYRLIWQKEPGMLAPDLNITVASPKNPASLDGVDNVGKIHNDTATFTGRLDQDRTITINY